MTQQKRGMPPVSGWFETIDRLEGNEAKLRDRPYAMIETRGGRLTRIQFRPIPRWGSWLEIGWSSGWGKSRRERDCCRLYYSQPWGHRNFLTLNYVVSTWGTTLRTFVRSLQVLEQVAAIKQSDALLCEVSTRRITDRMMARQGWESQSVSGSRRRHWIKRFYGEYPVFLSTRCSTVRTD